MNKDRTQLDVSSSEEAEQAQARTMLHDAEALDKLRQQLAQQRSRPSLELCEQCGEDIPLARRQAVLGVTMCIYCQTLAERFRANHRQPGGSSE